MVINRGLNHSSYKDISPVTHSLTSLFYHQVINVWCGRSCARNPPKYSRVSTRINIYENPPVFICARQLVLRRCSVNVNKSTASKLVTLTWTWKTRTLRLLLLLSSRARSSWRRSGRKRPHSGSLRRSVPSRWSRLRRSLTATATWSPPSRTSLFP